MKQQLGVIQTDDTNSGDVDNVFCEEYYNETVMLLVTVICRAALLESYSQSLGQPNSSSWPLEARGKSRSPRNDVMALTIALC